MTDAKVKTKVKTKVKANVKYKPHKDELGRRLRWMTENLQGAYNAKHPSGHPHAGDPCTNSGTCILVLCYMNALGKVLLEGGPESGRRDFLRFREFLHRCMPDYVHESSGRAWGLTPKKRTGGDEWLYEVFRCGFVHGYPAGDVAWGRKPGLDKYWFEDRSRLTLNIDELVRGFLRGIEEFRRIAAGDPNLRSHFREYITAD